MYSFQQGDKVRHKVHGHVLDILSVDGDTLEVGFTYADVHICEWHAAECELLIEDKPVPVLCDVNKLPSEHDFDKNGRLYVKFLGSCVSITLDEFNGNDSLLSIAERMEWWMHTPDWSRKSLHESCKGCEHDWNLTQTRCCLTNNKWYCDKLKLECLEPHYINGVPCHLAEV